MKIKKHSQAGSLESSDLLVNISPCDEGIDLRIDSPVDALYGDTIRSEVMEIVNKFNVTSAQIRIIDKGALPYAVKARVEAALKRAME